MAKKNVASGRERGAKEAQPAAPQIARALDHPMRVRILAALNERSASAKELEAVVGGNLPNLSYHCRQLLKYGCIEIASQEQVRGAIKTRYRATTRMLLDDNLWARLPAEVRDGISVAAVNEATERARKAIEAQTFDSRPDRHVVTVKFDADEQAWAEASELVEDAFRQLTMVEAGAAARKGPKFRVTVSMLSYESPQERLT